ncbi:MAG: SUMF1/EgtB/PvdO family nonheme iron enzyme [Hyphomonadaceae bacterium]|nr:SUMF1/EgtB/PvdO family nonheme iron enzyme [Hyphomonadaceae bacterium]
MLLVLRAFFALVLALAFSLSADAQTQSRRIALVIGNGAYQAAEWRLPNPPADAALMAERLRALDFEVDLVTDANRAQMEAAFQRFGQRLRSSGRSAVAVFFYAGHGAQRETTNYLVPTDASARNLDELRFQAPPMQSLLQDMAAAGNAVNIIILDACRDMPFEEGFRAIGRGGLADMGTPPNVFIAYAATPGRTASDGTSGNSPYTTALADALANQASEPIALLFGDVGSNVRAATRGGQFPEYRNGLGLSRWSFRTAAASGGGGTGTGGAGTDRTPPPPPRSLRAGDALDDCGGEGWCPQMVVIPAGALLFGSPASEGGRRANEGPQQPVRIASIAVGKYEVTFDEWAACANAGACSGNILPSDEGWGRGTRPVINVSWDDAQEYVRWLAGRTHKPYRLLTEGEWEYAARAGTETSAPWGRTASHDYANYGADFCCSGIASGRDEWVNTAPVGAFPPNAFGLHDMIGNVAEWVEDCYYAELAGFPREGTARTEANCTGRVDRGAAWSSSPEYVRSAFRSAEAPSQRTHGLGFRVARALDPPRP